MDIQIITTNDQSHTLFLPELNEKYHSWNGALAESRYVYLEMGLDFVMAQQSPDELAVFEVGMGTGLNVLLSLEWSKRQGIPVYYHTVEKFPLPESIWSKLNYGEMIGKEAPEMYPRIHTAPSGTSTPLHGLFTLRKEISDVSTVMPTESSYHIVFFDAFAPNKQPEMWSEAIFRSMYRLLRIGGCLVTYCAQSNFQRTAKSVGFRVEKLPGPLGKREMIRLIKPGYE